MPKLNYQPSQHGFHFDNNFTNHVGLITTRGLCGGMSLASFNYYRHGYPIPTHRAASFATADGLPPEHSRLRDYIYWQQIGSFASVSGFFFPHFGSDEDMLRDQYRASVADFDRVRRAIDRNLFVLLGLRSSQRGNVLGGHQTLAYGYDESPRRVWIYDPNYPDQEMYVEADAARERIIHKHADGEPSDHVNDYGSFFVQLELDPRTGHDRPAYFDLGVQSGLHFSAPVGDGLRQVGERLEIEAVVRNFGDYAAHVQALGIWARDPRGANRDGDFGQWDRTTTIRPGQEIRLRKTIERFGEEPGFYRFGISYLSEQNHWIEVPALGSGARTTASIELVQGVDAGRDYGTGTYAGPGTYFIRARHSGKVIDVNIDWSQGQNNGQPVYQHDLNNGDNQKFIVEPLPDGYVRFCPKHSRANNRCLDVTGISRENGATIQQWEWNGGHNQQFAIEPMGDHYRVRARHSELYWDIAGLSLDNRARLTQWGWWAGDNQLFQFIPTS